MPTGRRDSPRAWTRVVRRAFDRTTELANGLGSVWILGLMILVVGDVVGRALTGLLARIAGGVAINLSIRGTPELVKLSIVGIVFLQVAHTLRHNRHVRSTAVIDRLRPSLAEAMTFLAHLLGAALCALIVWSSWVNMVRAWRIGEYEGEGALRVPVAPSRTIVIIGSALLGLQFARLALGNLRRLRRLAGREGGDRWTPP